MTARLARTLERMVVSAGILAAWLGLPLLVASVAFTPLARWTGWGGDAPAAELGTLAFLAVTMTSFGYAYASGEHVRLDVMRRRFSARANAAIELVATIFIVLPLCAVVLIDGAGATWLSLAQGEHWGDTHWPLQWAVRIWIPLGFALLMAAALASAFRSALTLARR